MHRGPAQTGMRPLPRARLEITTKRQASLPCFYSATAVADGGQIDNRAPPLGARHRGDRRLRIPACAQLVSVENDEALALLGNVKISAVAVNCAKVMPLRFSSRMTSARTTWAGGELTAVASAGDRFDGLDQPVFYHGFQPSPE